MIPSKIYLASIILNQRGHTIKIREFFDKTNRLRTYIQEIDGVLYTTKSRSQKDAHMLLDSIMEVELNECTPSEESTGKKEIN